MTETQNRLGITEEQIRIRAYEKFIGRVERCEEPIHGRDVQDWVSAEQELLQEANLELNSDNVDVLEDLLMEPFEEGR